jgi:hypothetical protein
MQVARDPMKYLLKSMDTASIILLIKYSHHENDPHKNSGGFLLKFTPDLHGAVAVPNFQLTIHIIGDVLDVAFLAL